jgi:hypothetical protein
MLSSFQSTSAGSSSMTHDGGFGHNPLERMAQSNEMNDNSNGRFGSSDFVTFVGMILLLVLFVMNNQGGT